jgi:hypothetical protein
MVAPEIEPGSLDLLPGTLTTKAQRQSIITTTKLNIKYMRLCKNFRKRETGKHTKPAA